MTTRNGLGQNLWISTIVALASACGHTAVFDAGPMLDAPQDVTMITDATDHSAPDVSHDISMTDTGPVCNSNGDCNFNVNLTQCDLTIHACVHCLADGPRLCAAGYYCGASDSCTIGCAADADCNIGGDGSALTCNTTTHLCVGCHTSDDCPVGTICGAGTCNPGCDGSHGCPALLECCHNTCISVATDPMNCGECGTVCSTAGCTSMCASSMCSVVCNPGFGDCDMNPSNGCEADTFGSGSNCGGCGMPCDIENGSGGCVRGVCTLDSCNPGFTDCDHDPRNGCESNTGTDPMNCGTCGHACMPTESCITSVCGCTSAETRCPSGACANLMDDPMNCGACGTACPVGMFCGSGTCGSTIGGYGTATVPPTLTWVDVCSMPGATMQLAGQDDEIGTPMTIPFSFAFYDANYTSATLSSNGWIAFGTTGINIDSSESAGLDVPDTTAPGPAFFFYADDLVQTTGYCITTIGTAPNRQFVVEMTAATLYEDDDTSSDIAVEFFLDEGTDSIDVIYRTVTGDSTDGSTQLVGMQNETGTNGFAYIYETPGTLASGFTVRFVPL